MTYQEADRVNQIYQTQSIFSTTGANTESNIGSSLIEQDEVEEWEDDVGTKEDT